MNFIEHSPEGLFSDQYNEAKKKKFVFFDKFDQILLTVTLSYLFYVTFLGMKKPRLNRVKTKNM